MFLLSIYNQNHKRVIERKEVYYNGKIQQTKICLFLYTKYLAPYLSSLFVYVSWHDMY